MATAQKKHIVIDCRIRRSTTGRYIDRLVEHLQTLPAELHYSILVQPDDPWQPTDSRFKRVDCPFPQFSLNPISELNFTLQLYRLKADLVHFPLNQQPLLYFRPVVTTTMDFTLFNFPRPGKTLLPVFKFKMLAYRFLFWYSNKKSAAIITLTNHVRDELARHYPFTKSKTTTTYCASEPPLAGEAQQPDSVSTDSPFLLFVGTALPHKNLEFLVDAMPKLRESHPDLQLVLVGKKEQYYEALDTYIADQGARDYVTTTGWIPDEQLKWLYRHCQAYVFPSLSEGFGLPALEAMVHDAPVVSSNATCLPEVCGDAAEYFGPTDQAAFVAAVRHVLEDAKYRKVLITAGRKRAKAFSWQRMAEQTLAIYKNVLRLK